MSTSRRVAVTSPQTRLARARRRYRGRWRPTTLDPAEAPRAVELHTAQKRTAIAALVALCALVFALPLLLSGFPELDTVRVAGVPASWLAVAVLPFPTMAALAFWHLHRAEHAEREAEHTQHVACTEDTEDAEDTEDTGNAEHGHDRAEEADRG